MQDGGYKLKLDAIPFQTARASSDIISDVSWINGNSVPYEMGQKNGAGDSVLRLWGGSNKKGKDLKAEVERRITPYNL